MQYIEKFKESLLKLLEIAEFKSENKEPFIKKLLLISLGEAFFSFVETLPENKRNQLINIFNDQNDPLSMVSIVKEISEGNNYEYFISKELRKNIINFTKKLEENSPDAKKMQFQLVLDKYLRD